MSVVKEAYVRKQQKDGNKHSDDQRLRDGLELFAWTDPLMMVHCYVLRYKCCAVCILFSILGKVECVKNFDRYQYSVEVSRYQNVFVKGKFFELLFIYKINIICKLK